MSVEKANIVIVVFAMPGCHACHEYLPRLRAQIDAFQKAGHPIVEYEPGMTVERGMIPVIIVDSTSQDPSVQTLADQHQIHALPTTLVMPRRGRVERIEGSMPEHDVQNLLMAAVAANY